MQNIYVVLISVTLQCKCEISLTQILIMWHYFLSFITARIAQSV
jgi:hypothetical protein